MDLVLKELVWFWRESGTHIDNHNRVCCLLLLPEKMGRQAGREGRMGQLPGVHANHREVRLQGCRCLQEHIVQPLHFTNEKIESQKVRVICKG